MRFGKASDPRGTATVPLERHWLYPLTIGLSLWLGTDVVRADPLKLHPDNPHYLLFRGKPTVLVGSSEHYGSIINRDFNYVRYLDTLAANGLNVTRIFSGQYHERSGKFNPAPNLGSNFEIVENTLAPDARAYVAPWPRTRDPGALDGGAKFDLTRWNGEYFERLKDFMNLAAQRGIIVEMSLFSPYYVNDVGDYLWEVSPWNSHNNVNGIGEIDAADALSLKNVRLLAVQEAMVRKLVTELHSYDNVYYEICNEPYKTDVSMQWQAHMAKVITRTEASLGVEHLILQEFADPNTQRGVAGMRTHVIERRLPEVSLLAFHTAVPDVVLKNYSLNRPIGQNETLFLFSDASNRLSAWRILLAGGAFHDGMDYAFTRGHEDGSFLVPAGGAGGGSATLRQQLGILHRFMDGLDFIHMRPAPEIIHGGVPSDAVALALAEEGKSYAVYVSRGGRGRVAHPDAAPHRDMLRLSVPRGTYIARWLDPQTGTWEKGESVTVSDGPMTLTSPDYVEDIALRIVVRTPTSGSVGR